MNFEIDGSKNVEIFSKIIRDISKILDIDICLLVRENSLTICGADASHIMMGLMSISKDFFSVYHTPQDHDIWVNTNDMSKIITKCIKMDKLSISLDSIGLKIVGYTGKRKRKLMIKPLGKQDGEDEINSIISMDSSIMDSGDVNFTTKFNISLNTLKEEIGITELYDDEVFHVKTVQQGDDQKLMIESRESNIGFS